MTMQAMSWALDHSRAAGNDRLVLLIMCHHTDELGFCGLSKRTLADETLLSESTAHRAQQALVDLGEIEPADGRDAPAWWLGIAANRRPRLFRMVGFLGSQYATPIHRRAGVSLRGRRGVTGVSQGSTTPQLTCTDATRTESSEQRTEKEAASSVENDATPPPWLAQNLTWAEWIARDTARPEVPA